MRVSSERPASKERTARRLLDYWFAFVLLGVGGILLVPWTGHVTHEVLGIAFIVLGLVGISSVCSLPECNPGIPF